jgi:hypothetical protein
MSGEKWFDGAYVNTLCIFNSTDLYVPVPKYAKQSDMRNNVTKSAQQKRELLK